MKQMIKIIRKVGVEKQYMQKLLCEQDYWLGSLWVAMQDDNEDAKQDAITNLKRIQDELDGLTAYA